MVNTEEFIKRLEIILDYYGLNASAFADKIGDVFPDVDLYWILNGKGSFPKNNETAPKIESKQEKENFPNKPTPITEHSSHENLFSKESYADKVNVENPKKEEVQNVVNR